MDARLLLGAPFSLLPCTIARAAARVAWPCRAARIAKHQNDTVIPPSPDADPAVAPSITGVTLGKDFFAAAAQLIPLLVVAAAVDTRAWASREPSRPSEVSFELLTLVAITTAWVVALYVVGTGQTSPLASAIVALGLAVGWVQIVGSIGVHQLRRLGHAKVTRRQRVWLATLVFMPLTAVLVLWVSTV